MDAVAGQSGDSISAYLIVAGMGGETASVKFKLYDSSYNEVLNGLTAETTTSSYSATWVTANFTGTKPTLTASATYYITVLTGGDGLIEDDCNIYYATTGGAGVLCDPGFSYPTFSNPYDPGVTIDIDGITRIYCTYSATPVAGGVTETDANLKRNIYLDSSKKIGSDTDKAGNMYIKTWDFTSTGTKRNVKQKTKDFGS